MDHALRAFARERLATVAGPVGVPDPQVAAALRADGLAVAERRLDRLTDGVLGALALLADELSAAGAHAEELVAEAARVLHPGGLLLASARNRVHAAATRRPVEGLRTYTGAELERLLGQRGFAAEWGTPLLAAPGAAAAVAARDAVWQPDLDVAPGLLDAAPRLVATCVAPASPQARSRVFFATLPRKVVAAAVVCRDAAGRLLVVHDTFKGCWTIPGGVVDADEDPRSAAAREAWEEAGVSLEVGVLLGVFAASWPDRLMFLFAATPVGNPAPAPVHRHEIDDAAWMPLDVALGLLTPAIAAQVHRGLEQPGGVWHDRRTDPRAHQGEA